MRSDKTITARIVSLVRRRAVAMTPVNFPNHLMWCVVLRTRLQNSPPKIFADEISLLSE
jgi:hypothetical protein